MEEPLQLPIKPANDSLQAHIAALDQLSSRLAALTSQTRWPARVPLTSKASMAGAVVHTNDIKVHVGDGWWIEMTAAEAREYEHARMTERTASSSHNAPIPKAVVQRYQPAVISFDPIFSGPVAGPSRYREQPAADASSAARAIGGAAPSPAAPQPRLKALNPEPKDAKGEGMSLEDVLEEFVEKQKTLSESSGRSLASGGSDPVLNEEGLPIHEIREDEHGDIIGPPPEATTSGDEPKSAEREEDYWTPEAAARREALRRKVFNESPSLSGSDTETDDEPPLSERRPSWTPKTLAPTPPRSASPTQASPLTPAPPRPDSPPHRRPSFNATPGKSILKPPTARKKSVSFDESVPLPPDSPDPGNRMRTIAGFPAPTSLEDGAISPRPVPIIPPPIPHKTAAKADGFAGFKRGFLDKPTPVPPPSSSSTTKPAEVEKGKGKRPSLFAQRMAEAAVRETAPPAASTSSTMKSEVMERPPVSSASTSRITPSASQRHANGDGQDNDEEYDDDEDEEDEDEYDLDDALLAREVALEYHRRQAYRTMSHEVDPDLADEDIHARPPTFAEDGEEEDAGNVMLALPRVDAQGRPMIVNPTPDDVRRFVRVGRLENGNLVLAEGEKGWSDDEADGDGGEGMAEAGMRKENRERMKRQLLGEEPAPSSTASNSGTSAPSTNATTTKDTVQEVGLPPTIGVAPVRETAAVCGVKERPANLTEVEPPKKVSRFKQARMGL